MAKSPPSWLAGPTRPCARCGRPCWSKLAVPLHRTCKPQGAPRTSVSWGERKRRAAAVSAHREAYGSWCPGWRSPPHYVDERKNPLTADHTASVYATGDEGGPLQVLCRSHNSSKREKSGRVTVRPGKIAETSGSTYSPSGTC